MSKTRKHHNVVELMEWREKISMKTTPSRKTVKQQREPDNLTEKDETLERLSITLPAYLRRMLTADAKRRRRPISKQVELILAAHYGIDDIQIDGDAA